MCFINGSYFFIALDIVLIIILTESMGKQRLSVHRKNELRKKYGFFRVRIPLLESISVLKVTFLWSYYHSRYHYLLLLVCKSFVRTHKLYVSLTRFAEGQLKETVEEIANP